MNESQEQIHLKFDNQEYGPYSEGQIHQMLRTGQIAPNIEGKWSEFLGWQRLNDSEKFRSSIPGEQKPMSSAVPTYSWRNQKTKILEMFEFSDFFKNFTK